MQRIWACLDKAPATKQATMKWHTLHVVQGDGNWLLIHRPEYCQATALDWCSPHTQESLITIMPKLAPCIFRSRREPSPRCANGKVHGPVHHQVIDQIGSKYRL
jgi:hypothetical protein